MDCKEVSVINDLIFGGESQMGYQFNTKFHFARANVIEPRIIRSTLRSDWEKPSYLVHLASIVDFTGCQAVGKQVTRRCNVEGIKRVFDQAVALGASRLVYASYFSNYGFSLQGQPVNEDPPHAEVALCRDNDRC